MDEVRGLSDFIRSKKYREAMDLPKEVVEVYQTLAQGEYNKNYSFIHPKTGEKLVLRINFGSQMHLERQIEYEFNALGLIEKSKRTPKPIYVDASLSDIGYGVMVMGFLEGVQLDYRIDLKKAAACLADIHSVILPKENILIKPENPIDAMLNEFEEMFFIYENNPFAESSKKMKIKSMLDKVKNLAKKFDGKNGYKCCINTELNSSNFLIHNGKAFLVDWEKPIFADPAQDLAHFLAPTTTFWKTDIILGIKEKEEFLSEYISSVDNRFNTISIKEKTDYYIPFNCMRGITWCAMAFVQYENGDKGIRNEITAKKLKAYLNDEFLELIDRRIDI